MKCECLTKMDELLKPMGLQLATSMVMEKDPETGQVDVEVYPFIDTVKIDPKDRKVKTKPFFPTFCPFCGEKCRPKK